MTPRIPATIPHQPCRHRMFDHQASKRAELERTSCHGRDQPDSGRLRCQGSVALQAAGRGEAEKGEPPPVVREEGADLVPTTLSILCICTGLQGRTEAWRSEDLKRIYICSLEGYLFVYYF